MTDKATVLFVDDEEAILRSLKMLFKSQYAVKTTTDGNEAIAMVQKEKVHVIVSDQRMPIMPGVDVLRSVKEVSPNTMRLLLTGYSDWSAMVGSVNEGEVFRFINKPWVNEEIKSTIEQAVEIARNLEGIQQKDVSKETDDRLAVLIIDDDQSTFDTVSGIVGDKYAVKWGKNIDEAFATLSEDANIAVVVSEVKIGGEDITAPLKTLKEVYPNILTLVLTSFQDTKLLIELINQGQIYRFMPKPILPKLVDMSVAAAIRHYRMMQSTPQLTKRYAVEKPKEGETKVSGKIMGYLQKIRQRMK
jgi:DNA-binding NtrC family response regulator